MKQNKFFLIVTLFIAGAIFAAIAILPGKKSAETIAPEIAKSNQQSLVKERSPVKGNKDAPVTIVEFLDPECESCRAMHPIVKQLLKEYDGKIKVVSRFMLYHGNSRIAAVTLEEAHEQGKFDQALDKLFDKLPEWGDHSNPRAELIPVFVEQAGVNLKNMDNSTLAVKHGKKVDEDHSDGTAAGVRGTPTFFVNGVMIPELGYDAMKQAIEIALSQK